MIVDTKEKSVCFFNNLTLEEQKDFLNHELNKGKSLTKISSEINISRKTFRDRMLKINYKYDKNANQFVLESNIQKKNTQNNKKIDNELVEIFTDNDLKNNLINLAMIYDKIKNVVDYFDDKSIQKYDNVIENHLREKLLNEKDKNVRTTIRVNEGILKDFDIYCNENKEYLKQDLISAALYEFLDKRNFYLHNKNPKEIYNEGENKHG